MTGETDLATLLASMRPDLDTTAWVFTTAPAVPVGVSPAVVVREDEGLTLVVTREEAERAGLSYDYLAARITLRVHSALDAVGLTAAVATVLAERGISCNVVAGYFHDHLFVPFDRGQESVDALTSLGSAG